MNLKEKTVVIDNKIYRYSKIVMLSVDVSKRYNCTQDLIVKCIKEWIPIGESKREVNKLSISKNWSQGVLEYYEPQHLYFISTDKIRERDWCIIFNNKLPEKILLRQNIYGATGSTIGIDDYLNKYCYKIIASTDPSLNLPKPSDSFLKVYIDAYNNNKIPFNNIDINSCYFKPNENSSRKLHCIQLQISLTSENLKILKEVYPYDYVLKNNII